MHDENYKRLFAFPRMVTDLLRGFVAGDWLDEVDFSTLHKLSPEYVSDELLKRHGDTVWCMRVGDDWLYLLLLLEFQSEDDPGMALRILTYTSLLYQELRRNKAPVAVRRLPAVLPVVLYNGDSPWKAPLEVGELIAPVAASLAPYQPAQRYAVLDERHVAADDLPTRNLMSAVVGLEQSHSLADLVQVVEALREWLQDGEGDLQRAFADWVRGLAARLAPGGAKMPAVRTLEDVRMTLEERVAEWPKRWLEQGLEQGREQGLEHERALLCRQAAARFGADTAQHLADLLASVADAEFLAEVGDWLVRCETGDEFLVRARSVPAAGNHKDE